MALFTPAIAREMAARSAESRRLRIARLKAPPANSAFPPPQAEITAREIANNTLEHIRVVCKRLADRPALPPDELDALTRSLERLWKIHAHAAQIPQPAHRKEARQPRGSQAIDLEPVAFSVLPEPSPMTDSPAPAPTVATTAPETTPLQPAGQDPKPITLSPDEAARLLSP